MVGIIFLKFRCNPGHTFIIMDTMKHFLKKVRVSTLVFAVLIVLAVILAASLVAVYLFPHSGRLTDGLERVLPYPAVIIGYRDGITYATLADNMRAIKRFYEAQDFSTVGLRVDFSTDDGKKRFKVREKEVLNKMIEDDAIRILAGDRGIRVSREEAAQAVSRKLEEHGNSQAVTQDLDRLYGWTLSDFQEKVVLPSLYQEKLEASFTKEVDATSRSKKQISSAQEALRAGTAFATVAREYSEGNTASKGGALGWFALEDLAQALRQPVANQKIGVPGDMVESELGFHIVLVEEVKKEDQKQLYRLSQIFTRRVTFADWLAEKMRGLSVIVLSPEYTWNAEEARVEFKEQELRDFEKQLFEKSDGDASLFF